MYHHDINVVRSICQRSLDNPVSVLHENLTHCCNALNFDKNMLLDKTVENISTVVRQACRNACRSNIDAHTVIELCNVRDKMLLNDVINDDEVQVILHDLCLN